MKAASSKGGFMVRHLEDIEKYGRDQKGQKLGGSCSKAVVSLPSVMA